LFTRPANLLVMDEPTNDLDVETLELLEELLLDYQGTLLLVSHDRAFLDNVVTSALVFEGDGHIGEYVGGYSDWLRQRQAVARESKRAATEGTAKPSPSPAKRAEKQRKLSYKDQRELEALPARIEALETEQAQLHSTVNDVGFYQRSPDDINAALERLEAIGSELETCYERWGVLEEQSTAS
jgi:ATP-binding cassette subfamily F protein uup